MDGRIPSNIDDRDAPLPSLRHNSSRTRATMRLANQDAAMHVLVARTGSNVWPTAQTQPIAEGEQKWFDMAATSAQQS